MQNETWKIIPNLTKYEASTKGNIRNKKVQKNLSQRYNAKGYKIISLEYLNGQVTRFLVHRLVALTFLPNPNNHPIVDHKDKTRSNNNLDNLRWVDIVESNLNRNLKQDLRVVQKTLDNQVVKIWDSIRCITNELKYTKTNILKCCNSQISKYKNFKWEWYIKREPNKLTIIKDITNYKTIGMIDNYDFSNYKISENPEISIIGKRNVLIHPWRYSDDDYFSCILVDKNTKERIGLSIHQIVYAIHNGNKIPQDGIIDHIDENKSNNKINNLQLLTRRNNTIKSNGKRVKQIDIITGKVINIYNCLMDAYNAVKVNTIKNRRESNQISQVCNGKRQTSYGYKWKWALQNDIIDETTTDEMNYKSIGFIDDYNFSDYKICENPEISIINKFNCKIIFRNDTGQYRFGFVDKNTKKQIFLPIDRLIFALHNNNKLPQEKIIHKDNNKLNNIIDNLKLHVQ